MGKPLCSLGRVITHDHPDTSMAAASQTVLEFGADACLLKPFRFSDLLFRLESFAHHQRAA